MLNKKIMAVNLPKNVKISDSDTIFFTQIKAALDKGWLSGNKDELQVVIGRTGVGKTTLLLALNNRPYKTKVNTRSNGMKSTTVTILNPPKNHPIGTNSASCTTIDCHSIDHNGYTWHFLDTGGAGDTRGQSAAIANTIGLDAAISSKTSVGSISILVSSENLLEGKFEGYIKLYEYLRSFVPTIFHDDKIHTNVRFIFTRSQFDSFEEYQDDYLSTHLEPQITQSILCDEFDINFEDAKRLFKHLLDTQVLNKHGMLDPTFDFDIPLDISLPDSLDSNIGSEQVLQFLKDRFKDSVLFQLNQSIARICRLQKDCEDIKIRCGSPPDTFTGRSSEQNTLEQYSIRLQVEIEASTRLKKVYKIMSLLKSLPNNVIFNYPTQLASNNGGEILESAKKNEFFDWIVSKPVRTDIPKGYFELAVSQSDKAFLNAFLGRMATYYYSQFIHDVIKLPSEIEELTRTIETQEEDVQKLASDLRAFEKGVEQEKVSSKDELRKLGVCISDLTYTTIPKVERELCVIEEEIEKLQSEIKELTSEDWEFYKEFSGTRIEDWQDLAMNYATVVTDACLAGSGSLAISTTSLMIFEYMLNVGVLAANSAPAKVANLVCVGLEWYSKSKVPFWYLSLRHLKEQGIHYSDTAKKLVSGAFYEVHYTGHPYQKESIEQRIKDDESNKLSLSYWMPGSTLWSNVSYDKNKQTNKSQFIGVRFNRGLTPPSIPLYLQKKHIPENIAKASKINKDTLPPLQKKLDERKGELGKLRKDLATNKHTKEKMENDSSESHISTLRQNKVTNLKTATEARDKNQAEKDRFEKQLEQAKIKRVNAQKDINILAYLIDKYILEKEQTAELRGIVSCKTKNT